MGNIKEDPYVFPLKFIKKVPIEGYAASENSSITAACSGLSLDDGKQKRPDGGDSNIEPSDSASQAGQSETPANAPSRDRAVQDDPNPKPVNPNPPPPPQFREESFFIRQSRLEMNSKTVSSLSGTNTEDDCITDFTQFQVVCGNTFTGYSNNINYKVYKEGFALMAYDLTNSHEGFLELFSPGSRVGYFKYYIDFSSETLYPLTVLFFTEWNRTLSVRKDGTIESSFSS